MFAGSPNDFGPGSKPELILVGDLNSDGFDEVVMLNSDLTIDVFRNVDQAGHFEFKTPIDVMKRLADQSGPPGSNPSRLTSSSRFFLEDFGDGQRGLAALLGVANGKVNDRAPPKGEIGIVTLKGDGNFGFTDPRLTIETLPRGPKHLGTHFITGTLSPADTTEGISSATPPLIGRFANPLHGNGNLDFASITAVESLNKVWRCRIRTPLTPRWPERSASSDRVGPALSCATFSFMGQGAFSSCRTR